MAYLSKELEIRLKIKGKQKPTLVKKNHSCGIFQEYDASHTEHKKEDRD